VTLVRLAIGLRDDQVKHLERGLQRLAVPEPPVGATASSWVAVSAGVRLARYDHPTWWFSDP